MVDIIKQDMTDIWAVAGDVVAPDSAKVRAGWAVEAVPRQWWNWFENRQDTNIAYMLQKGIPEWDQFTEYLSNKSYVQRNGIIYKSILTATNQDPSTAPLYWVKAFVESSAGGEALKTVTPVVNGVPYFTSTSTVGTFLSSAFGRTFLNTADAVSGLALLGGQPLDATLTALAGVTATTNKLPYFNGTDTATVTDLTAFARTLLDDVDAATARATLGVSSAVDTAQALADGLATKQPLDATLTALAGVAATTNKLPYFTGNDLATVTDFTAFARTLLDDPDAATARTTLNVYSKTESDDNLTAGLATRQPLNALLTSVSALNPAANTMIYYSATNTGAVTTLTPFARTILDDADAVTVRTTIGANDAANLTTGLIDLARLPATLTGKNASTATALQTPRTIQGVAFDGTANITLSVVDKDSGTGSATLPAGTTAQRSASPVNGQIRYNTDTNEFEGYQNGSWAGIGGGTPLFTVLWWPSRAAIPAGYVPADGQLLTRATYNAAWTRINNGDVPLVTDAVWSATSTYRASYSNGNGTTNFRTPDLNGKQAGTVGAQFLRGDGTNSTGVAGQIQGDAYQDHNHFLNPNGTINVNLAVTLGGGGATTSYAVQGNAAGQGTRTSTSLAASTGEFKTSPIETRPMNATGVWIIKLLGGASEISQDDASLAVAELDAKMQYVSGRNRIINGDCRLAQRAAAAVSGTMNAFGGPDRFRATMQAAGGQFTQNASTFPDLNGVNVSWVSHTCNSVATNLAGTNYWSGITQAIEGTNSYDLRGNPVSISFLFRSNVTGTFSLALRDSSTYSYVTTFAATANVTTKVIVNVPAIPTAANIPFGAGIGMTINIGALNTATFQTSTLNAWQNVTLLSASGTTFWQATPGNFIAVTQLQLEKGTKATEFEVISFTDNIAQCQRYYQTGVSSTGGYGGAGIGNSFPVRFGIAMRATPTMTYTGGQVNCSTFDVRGADTQGFQVYSVTAATGGYAYFPQWTADAEI